MSGTVEAWTGDGWARIGTVDTLTYPTGDDGNPDMSFPIWFYPSAEERLAQHRADVAYVRALVRRELAP